MTPYLRASDREASPVLPLPCAGLRCSSRRSCAHYQASDFSGLYVVRMDRCATDADGRALSYLPIEPHRPLSEPATDWGDLS